MAAKAIIVLEDGTTFTGRSFGAAGEKVGEIVFNTQIVGYQEALTDPANDHRLICFGYPHIGNYGVNDRLNESDRAHASALIVKEYSKIVSNWQATGSLGDFMQEQGVIGVEGIDTRALTIHIRDQGEMKAIVSTKNFNVEELAAKAKNAKLEMRNTPFEASTKHEKGNSKVLINIGANRSLLAMHKGATLVGDDCTAAKILALEPEEVIISSGPGDPRERTALIAEVKKLVGQVKLSGIQNGACVLALALGATVERMKVGHHGMNIPVVDPATGKGEITMQNHSYGVQGPVAGSQGSKIEVIHKNLNDGSIEAFRTKKGDCVGTLYFPIDQRGKLPEGYKLV